MSTMGAKALTTRIVEEKMVRLFSEKKPFSEHLMKWEDDSFPDKYDQNFFEYTGQPTEEEFRQALDYQRRRGDRFIKLERNCEGKHNRKAASKTIKIVVK